VLCRASGVVHGTDACHASRKQFDCRLRGPNDFFGIRVYLPLSFFGWTQTALNGYMTRDWLRDAIWPTSWHLSYASCWRLKFSTTTGGLTTSHLPPDLYLPNVPVYHYWQQPPYDSPRLAVSYRRTVCSTTLFSLRTFAADWFTQHCGKTLTRTAEACWTQDAPTVAHAPFLRAAERREHTIA